MTALVIAEHDNGTLKGATLNTVTAAAAVRRRRARAGRRPQRRRRRAGRRADRRRDQGAARRRRPASTDGLAENVAAQVLAIASNYSHILFPATAHGKNVAPRVAAKLDVGQISDITKVDQPPTPSSARSTPATRSPPCRARTRSRSSPCAPPASMPRPPRAAAPRSRALAAAADSGKSTLRRQRDRQERPPRTDRRQDHRLAVAARWAAARSSTRC